MTNYQELLDKVDSMSLDEIKSVEEQIKPAYDVVQKEKREKAIQETKKNAEQKIAKYKYPFILHFAGHNIETDHIFENEKAYTSEEIRTKMLEHQYYEFSGEVDFKYLTKENVLLPIFQQHKKG